MADKLNEYIAARSRALDSTAIARDYAQIAEEDIAAAEELGRAAGMKAAAVKGGVPQISVKFTFPEGQEPPSMIGMIRQQRDANAKQEG
jgi:hypothetical protein